MKKKVIGLFTLLFIVLATISGVNAKGVLEADDTLNVTGNYNSSKFLFGNEITTTSNVDGLQIIAGNSINTSGVTSYGVYAGNSIYVNDSIEKDLFIFGNSINIGNKAVINRDAYLFGNLVKINANIGRNLRVGATTLDISGVTINGNIYVDADEIIMDNETVITGTFNYYENARVTGLEDATINKVNKRERTDFIYEEKLVDKILDVIFSIAAGFIVMFALFNLIPSSKTKLDNFKVSGSNVLGRFGEGLVVLIIVPFVSIIALFTQVLMPLSLIALLMYGICIYLSTLLVSYVAGKYIYEKLSKKENVYVSLIIGIILVKLLKLIPYVDFIIGVICLLVGLGIIYTFIKKREA